MYLGFVPTMIRESVGSCLYFLTYERIMRMFVKEGQKAADAPIQVSLLAGGMAGISYWAFVYPIDFIKTKIQVDNLADRKYRGMLDCIKQNRVNGISSFFTGFGVCMARSVPVNAGGFFVFEMAMRWLGRSNAS